MWGFPRRFFGISEGAELSCTELLRPHQHPRNPYAPFGENPALLTVIL